MRRILLWRRDVMCYYLPCNLLFHTQIVLYSLISKFIGYRWTFRLTAIFFALFTIIMPFSTQITGPVPANPAEANFSDYCQLPNSTEIMSVNANSVWRIPMITWVILTILYSFQTLLRYIMNSWFGVGGVAEKGGGGGGGGESEGWRP